MSQAVITVPDEIVLRGRFAILTYVETRIAHLLEQVPPGEVGPQIAVKLNPHALVRMLAADKRLEA